MISLQKTTDAVGYQNMQRGAAMANKTFRDAVQSTGQFEVQQMRLNSVTDDYIKKLNSQQMSFGKMAKQRRVAHAAYKQQLAMESMYVQRSASATNSNKGQYDVIIPKNASQDLDTARKRMAFFNAELKSGANQMINWGKNTQWAGRQLMVGFTMPVAAFGAAAGVMAYQVDKELTRIAKVYDTVATEAGDKERELGRVREDALNTATTAAQEYGYAMRETLEVQAELAATGKTGLELQRATQEVMRISRLGEVDTQTAIESSIALQTVFKQSNEELTESFDYMNSVENATSLATADFAAAIPIAAAPVREFGGDVKELGILLTAMKENGIGAVQGANALKATMQRLGRPSKQIRMEWQELTGTDITKLVDDSENLTEVFTKINHATRELSEPARRKAFAGLFGSYQVARMMAMTKGMQDLEDGVGQVSTAYGVAQQDSSEWAKTAQDEIEAYQKSISGAFQTSIATLGTELVEVGMPFLVFATKVVQAVTWIAEKFNALPNIAKIFIAAGIGAAALAGGILMLVGLTANLIGNGIKLFASMSGLATKMELVDTETKAMRLSSDLTTQAFLDEATAASKLTNELQLLAASMNEANTVHRSSFAKAQAHITQTPGGPVASVVKDPAALRAATEAYAVTDSAGRTRYRNRNPEVRDSAGRTQVWVKREVAEKNALLDLNRENLAMEAATNNAKEVGTKITQQQAIEEGRRHQRMRAGAAIMIAESAAMAVMIGNAKTAQNEMVDTLAQGVMVAGMLAPAVSAATPAVVGLAGRIKGVAKEMNNSRKAAFAFGGGVKGIIPAAVGMSRALAGAMGPVGWIVAGLTIAGGVLYKVYSDQKKAREQAIKDQRTLNNLSKEFAETTGKAWKDYTNLNRERLGTAGVSKKELDAYEISYEYWKNDENEEAQNANRAFREGDQAKRDAIALQVYTDALVHMGMSSGEAAEHLRAFFIVNKVGYAEANVAVKDLNSEVSKLKTASDWVKLLEVTMEGVSDAINRTDPDKMKDLFFIDGSDEMTAEITDVLGVIEEILASDMTTPDQATAALDSYIKMAGQGWDNLYEKWFASNDQAMEQLKKRGVDSASELKELLSGMSAEERGAFENDLMLEGGLPASWLADMWQGVRGAEELEQAMLDAWNASKETGGELKSIEDIKLDSIFLKFLPKDEQSRIMAGLQEINAGLGGLDATFSLEWLNNATGTSEEMLKLQANAILAAHGLKEGATFAEAMENWTNKTKDEAKGLKSEANGVANAFSVAAYNARGLAGRLNMAGLDNKARAEAMRETMGGIQEEIADAEREALDDRIDAQREADNAMWDARKAGLDERHDREKRALDSAWDAKRDALEKYWEARVDAIDKAIEREEKAEEKRQEMFDAELARIERLADIQNTNIDFNVALNTGDLDEAAKIANNAEAENAKFVFDREKERGSKKSEKRVEKLENRREGVEDAQEKAMEAFDKREERAKRHLDKMQKMEQDSLDARAKADMEAKEDAWKREKDNLDRILETFLAFTPRTRKELREHMKAMGISMDNFGDKVLKPMGKSWGSYFKDAMFKGLNDAALKAISEAIWKEMGEKGKNELIHSLGFESENQYKKFITPKAWQGTNPTGQTGQTKNHEGGVVGGGAKDSRRGVAKTYHGTHPSEQMILAQKGEYIVNRKAAKNNASVLDAINNGGDVMGGIGATGPAGLMAAGMANNFMHGFMNKVANRKAKADRRAARAAAAAANYGVPTVYSLPGVKPWVLEAANYLGSKFGINTIGGVGDRSSNPYSDHPRGLALDFMTYDNVKAGNALASEALSLGPKLDATYMIWQKRIHSFDSRGWRDYSHPSGASNPTLDHMDHVHMSFSASGKQGDLPVFKGGKLAQGPGGSHHPTGRVGTTGSRIHGSPAAIDVSLPVGNKIYAVRDGVVSSSYDIRGHEPRAPHGGNGYRSYGRVITLNHSDGGSSLYAHLSQRYAQSGQRVKGGTVLGLSGDTGYSTGPHLHFGATPGPFSYLRKGTEYVKYDNTPAMLHRGESVLTKNITEKMREGVDRFASGDSGGYNNYEININGFNKNVDELAAEVVRRIKREESRKPQSRNTGRRTG